MSRTALLLLLALASGALADDVAKRKEVVVFECEGGTDKHGDTGHRADTPPLLRALEEAGLRARAVYFADGEHDRLLGKLGEVAAFVSRVDPGVYPKCTMTGYYKFLRALASRGVAAFNHPDDMEALGQKRSLLRLAGMPISVEQTAIYSNANEFKELFPKRLQSDGARVLKQNRGSKGEGVWLVRQYNDTESVVGGQVVQVLEAADGQSYAIKPLQDALDGFAARYLAHADDYLLDMPYLPRIKEGEIRLIVSGRSVTHVVEKTPAQNHKLQGTVESFSANLDAGATHTWLKPSQFPEVVQPFQNQLDEILRRMGVKTPPPLWTSDFIRSGPPEATRFVLSEINANCVGFSAHPELAHDIAVVVAAALEDAWAPVHVHIFVVGCIAAAAALVLSSSSAVVATLVVSRASKAKEG